MKLLDDGVTTKEHVTVPECVHTVTMEWFTSYRDGHDVSIGLMLLWHALICTLILLMIILMYDGSYSNFSVRILK